MKTAGPPQRSSDKSRTPDSTVRLRCCMTGIRGPLRRAWPHRTPPARAFDLDLHGKGHAGRSARRNWLRPLKTFHEASDGSVASGRTWRLRSSRIQTDGRRRPTRLTQTVAIVAGTLLLLVRQSGVPSWRTLWAEDGMFLESAIKSGWQALAVPYAGYVHAAPRLLATIAAAAPLEWASVVMSGGAAFLAACLALSRLPSLRLCSYMMLGLPYLVSASTTLCRSSGVQIHMQQRFNLHFLLLYAAWWAAISLPETRVDRVLSAGVVLLAGLSDPFVVVLTPIFVARLIFVRQAN